MIEAGWGGVWLEERDTPEAAVASAQVGGVGGLSYSSGTSGEKNEEMSKKCFSIKINWTIVTSCLEVGQQLSSNMLMCEEDVIFQVFCFVLCFILPNKECYYSTLMDSTP